MYVCWARYFLHITSHSLYEVDMGYDACKSLSAIPEANGRLLGNGWSRETRDSLSNGHGRVQDRAGIINCWWVKTRSSASHTLLNLNSRRLFSENWWVKSTRVFQPWELMLERLRERSISITWGFLNGWVMVCHGDWCWLCWLGSFQLHVFLDASTRMLSMCHLRMARTETFNQTMGGFNMFPFQRDHFNRKWIIWNNHR